MLYLVSSTKGLSAVISSSQSGQVSGASPTRFATKLMFVKLVII